jgi:hypothetical protein
VWACVKNGALNDMAKLETEPCVMETTDGGGEPTAARDLDQQNAVFAGTGGVSQENRAAGFRPAFRHRTSGEVLISSYADGRPATVHVLDGLPDAWLVPGSSDGQRCLRDCVDAGFVRDGRFYSREQAAAATRLEGE